MECRECIHSNTRWNIVLNVCLKHSKTTQNEICQQEKAFQLSRRCTCFDNWCKCSNSTTDWSPYR